MFLPRQDKLKYALNNYMDDSYIHTLSSTITTTYSIHDIIK